MIEPSQQKSVNSKIYIARQAILDSNGDVYGYELLYRNSSSNQYPEGTTETEATAKLYAEHFLGELSEVLADAPAFVNFDYLSLMNGVVYDFSPKDIVVEILESCEPTAELLDILQDLSLKGYTLALDDFIPNEKWEKFYPFIDIIKFDVRNISIVKCGMYIDSLKKYDIYFLAEKIETYKEYEMAKRWGFNLFQGYYFTKPQMIKKKRLSSSVETLLNLSKLITTTPLNYDNISEVITQSPSLSYQLIRYVNHSGLIGEIKSVKQALAYLGDTQLTRYCSYALLSQLGSDKPPILQMLSLKRARTMQLIAMLLGCNENSEKAYLTGLLSLVDAMLDININSLRASLCLDSEILDALEHQEGCIGQILQICILLEINDWDAISHLSLKLGLNESKVIALAIESDIWVSEML